ncbi:hypothetical protein Scep_009957 [Stephania cephalantha]|uniref:Uncharacterized protein n=1 Tax=Stephania cephalantha TaxID=152367 RepID=A0AAP0PGR9_9MAGN
MPTSFTAPHAGTTVAPPLPLTGAACPHRRAPCVMLAGVAAGSARASAIDHARHRGFRVAAADARSSTPHPLESSSAGVGPRDRRPLICRDRAPLADPLVHRLHWSSAAAPPDSSARLAAGRPRGFASIAAVCARAPSRRWLASLVRVAAAELAPSRRREPPSVPPSLRAAAWSCRFTAGSTGSPPDLLELLHLSPLLSSLLSLTYRSLSISFALIQI